MTELESACALALERVIQHRVRRQRLGANARVFIGEMATRSRAASLGRQLRPLSTRQSRWLLQLAVDHSSLIRPQSVAADAARLLRLQSVA